MATLFAVIGTLLVGGFIVAMIVAVVRGSRTSDGIDWDRELRLVSGSPSVEDRLAEIERRFVARLITADEREAARIRILSTLQ